VRVLVVGSDLTEVSAVLQAAELGTELTLVADRRVASDGAVSRIIASASLGSALPALALALGLKE
jgi:hypothetical protein